MSNNDPSETDVSNDSVEEMTAEASADDTPLELTAAEQVDLTMRQTLAAILGENLNGEGDFDYYDVFDWDTNPGVKQFYALALRNPYAFAVTFLPASTSWRDPPTIVDDADVEGDTEFEQELETLVDEVNLWEYCKRADKLAGIGEFGVLVLEFDDVRQEDVQDGNEQLNTDAFAKPVDGAEQLTGLRAFSEQSVDDVVLGGPGSGRWGLPLSYDLDLTDEDDDEDGTITQSGPDTMTVHHSRVIHIPSDFLLDDEVRGVPRQQPVYNNLIDIERTLGSAGQLAYRASAWGININIDKDYNIEDGGDELREQLHRWQAGLENVLRTHGADEVKSLGGEEIDPSNIIDPNIEAIASQPYMPPQSVLKGNETGERATAQDLKEFYASIGERRVEYDNPRIVRATIDRLIEYVLPDPRDGYSIIWDPLGETSEKEISEIQKNRSTVVKNIQTVVPGLTTEQIVAYLEEGEFPDDAELELEAAEDIDEDDPQVQAYLERRRERMGQPPALADGGEEVGNDG